MNDRNVAQLDIDTLFQQRNNEKKKLINQINKFSKRFNFDNLHNRHSIFFSQPYLYTHTRVSIIEQCHNLILEFNNLAITSYKKNKNFDDVYRCFSSAIELVSLLLAIPMNKVDRIDSLLCSAEVNLNIISLDLLNTKGKIQLIPDTLQERVNNNKLIDDLGKQYTKIHENMIAVLTILEDKGVRDHIIYDENAKEKYNLVQKRLDRYTTKLSDRCEELEIKLDVEQASILKNNS